jgi:hypothetical protein
MPIKRMRFKWDKETQQMVEIGDNLPADLHYVQDDSIPPTVSHATSEGLVFTSRSKLNEHYRQNGFVCTGGAHLTGRGAGENRYKADRDAIRRDVEIALNKIKWGMAPISEREKERCSQEERAYQEYKRRQR